MEDMKYVLIDVNTNDITYYTENQLQEAQKEMDRLTFEEGHHAVLADILCYSSTNE